MGNYVTETLAICIAALFPIAAGAGQNAVTEEKCKGIGFAFHKIAEFRDSRMGAEEAIALVEDRLNSYHRTGSHLRSNHKDLLRPIATLVYKRSDLAPTVLGAFGLSACRVEVAFTSDEARKASGLARLLKAAEKCQAKHGGGTRNRAASQCVVDDWWAFSNGPR